MEEGGEGGEPPSAKLDKRLNFPIKCGPDGPMVSSILLEIQSYKYLPNSACLGRNKDWNDFNVKYNIFSIREPLYINSSHSMAANNIHNLHCKHLSQMRYTISISVNFPNHTMTGERFPDFLNKQLVSNHSNNISGLIILHV